MSGRMKRRILSALLSLTLTVSMLPATVLAAELTDAPAAGTPVVSDTVGEEGAFPLHSVE